jgi:rhamnose utilization protein RhaD (predicted bifunctional aldolase and dehydrogenase)/NAD(P)-dependent dehydrogenase (short-subunit alcohol dehydrogenase family)
MKSRWDDAAANQAKVNYPNANVSEAVALRTYSARLLGAEPALVLHGGGNTSVKAKAKTIFGDTVDVIHVKGSGWDLATIEPPGHPAVRMEPLLKLLALPSMTDEQMVNELRLALLDASAPTPSVETLLHAALPATFIDHTHANALLSVVDQKNARALCEQIFGGDALLFIPYVMPGFGLARACKDAWDLAMKEKRSPTVMVLERHGIFTFGDTAKESYERMIAAVTTCEEFATKSASKSATKSTSTTAATPVTPVRPVTLSADETAIALATLRGAFARAAKEAPERAPILSLRRSDRILSFLERNNAPELSQRGCATPDHVLRTKPWPLHVSDVTKIDQELAAYGQRYDAYFESMSAKKKANPKLKKLDPLPRVVLIPKIGICAIGKSSKDAEAAADIYEHTINVIEDAEALGEYSPLGLDDLFDVEYWSLEQAKIKKEPELPLARRIAVITGAASGIGRATAELFVELGAHVVLCDRDAAALESVKTEFGKKKKKTQVATMKCDVTKQEEVDAVFRCAALTFGGVDLVVSNAGTAAEGKLETEKGEATLRASLEVNLLSHVNVAKSAVTLMRAQGSSTGGVLLFNASKSAFNQGPGFGPYAVPKAALVSLMRQYAVDLAKDGIRSNAINADRIRTNIFGGGMVESRAKARGITVDEYFRSNLLSREVKGSDVAEAFAWLAQAKATTGCVVTTDGGNAAAFPR